MLVSLANNTNLGAGSTTTFTYSPTSFQKMLLKIDDDSVGSTAIWVTIQLGSRTIVNDVKLFDLMGYQNLYSGFVSSGTDLSCFIDCGSWQLLNNENLYCTIRTTNEMNAVDVSAIVDGAGLNPIQYTVYTDNVFTSENVLCAIGTDASAAVLDEDATAVTIRNSIMSTSPAVLSGVTYYRGMAVSNGGSQYSLLYKENIPHTTSFNYSASATMDTILVAQSMPYTRQMLSQAKSRASLDQAFAS